MSQGEGVNISTSVDAQEGSLNSYQAEEILCHHYFLCQLVYFNWSGDPAEYFELTRRVVDTGRRGGG